MWFRSLFNKNPNPYKDPAQELFDEMVRQNPQFKQILKDNNARSRLEPVKYSDVEELVRLGMHYFLFKTDAQTVRETDINALRTMFRHVCQQQLNNRFPVY